MSTTRRVQSDALAYALRAKGRTCGTIARRLGVTRSIARRSIIRHEQRIQQLASGAEAHQASEGLSPRELASGAETNQASDALTPRQKQLIALVVQGLSNKQIAQALNISVGTVKVHLWRAYRKLGVPGRRTLVEQRAGKMSRGLDAS